MAVIVGIDEAGYGPLLGPLVITAAAFELGDEYLKSDMWLLLKKAVAKDKRKLSGRVLITDSKKAYNRKTGLAHLEKAVFVSLGLLDKKVENLHQLVKVLCGDKTVKRIADYNWYGDIEKATFNRDSQADGLAAAVLKSQLSEIKAKLVDIKTACLDVGYYNKMLESVNNKSTVAFTHICQLIGDLFKQYSRDNFQVVVDRQGGRVNYINHLMTMFPAMELRVIRQDNAISSYELKGSSGAMKIHFAVKADQKSLPVSLASMVSKYLREKLMEQLNSYFISNCSTVKPTAGYWSDGTRFIEDIKNYCPEITYDKFLLVRNK